MSAKDGLGQRTDGGRRRRLPKVANKRPHLLSIGDVFNFGKDAQVGSKEEIVKDLEQ